MIKIKRVTMPVYEKIKSETKTILDNVVEEEKARFALDLLEDSDQESTEAVVKQIVLIISALYHDQKYGGLSKKQMRSSEAQGMALIALLGKENSPVVRQATAELGTINCMAFQAQGRKWEALTMSTLVELEGRNLFSDSKGYPNLMQALQLFRLGFCTQALKSLQEGLNQGLTGDNYLEAKALEIQLLRLSGQNDLAINLANLMIETDLPNRLHIEAKWQILILSCQQDSTFWPMMNRNKSGNEFERQNYPLETFLWMYIQKDRDYREKFIKPRALIRRGIKPKEHPALWQIILLLNDCYSELVPMRFLLPRIGEALHNIHLLPTFEHQLLTLGCIARYLSNQRIFVLAATVLSQYHHFSLTSSDGGENDILGVLGDLFERSWFKAA